MSEDVFTDMLEDDLSDAPSPETDAAHVHPLGYLDAYPLMRDLARRLKRERDEARDKLILEMQLPSGERREMEIQIAKLRAINADLLGALEVGEKYIAAVDAQQAFTAPNDRITSPDLQQVRAAIAKAKQS